MNEVIKMKKVWYVVVGYFTMKRYYVFEDKGDAERMTDILNDELMILIFLKLKRLKNDVKRSETRPFFVLMS